MSQFLSLKRGTSVEPSSSLWLTNRRKLLTRSRTTIWKRSKHDTLCAPPRTRLPYALPMQRIHSPTAQVRHAHRSVSMRAITTASQTGQPGAPLSHHCRRRQIAHAARTRGLPWCTREEVEPAQAGALSLHRGPSTTFSKRACRTPPSPLSSHNRQMRQRSSEQTN